MAILEDDGDERYEVVSALSPPNYLLIEWRDLLLGAKDPCYS